MANISLFLLNKPAIVKKIKKYSNNFITLAFKKLLLLYLLYLKKFFTIYK